MSLGTTPIKPMKKYIIIILLISFFSIGEVYSCHCKDLRPLDSLRHVSFNNSDIVFLGELQHYDSTDNTFSFKITETFKGNPITTILKGKYFDSCSLIPKDKGLWIVYAEVRESGLINISQCLASRSEEKPTDISCYLPPAPPHPDKKTNNQDEEQYLKELKKKALKDWQDEIVILREWK
jgi:hypothetical protein